MKKFIAFMMALLMVMSLAGCKSDAPEAVVVEAGAVTGVETAETVGHRIVSLKYEGTASATEGKDADGAEAVKATKGAEVSEGAEAVNGAVEGIGSTESTTYGGNGADAVQPTKPTSESGSSKPSEGYVYEVIVDETEPTVPATETTKPTGEEPAPTEPTKPSEPFNPVDPVKPTEPSADYSEPVDPSEGETPMEPTQPSDPCPDHGGEEESEEHVHCWTCVHEESVWVKVLSAQCTCGVIFETRDGSDPALLWEEHVKSFSGRELLNHYDCYDLVSRMEMVSDEVYYWWCPSCNTRSDTNPNP